MSVDEPASTRGYQYVSLFVDLERSRLLLRTEGKDTLVGVFRLNLLAHGGVPERVLLLHSAVRYLVLLLGVAALGYALYGALGRRPYDPRMRKLAAAFAGSLHLQVLIGVVFLFTRQFYPRLAGHLFMMVFAAVAAQIVPSVMRRRPEEKRTWWPDVIGTLVALALIWGGLAAIERPLIGGLAL